MVVGSDGGRWMLLSPFVGLGFRGGAVVESGDLRTEISDKRKGVGGG